MNLTRFLSNLFGHSYNMYVCNMTRGGLIPPFANTSNNEYEAKLPIPILILIIMQFSSPYLFHRLKLFVKI